MLGNLLLAIAFLAFLGAAAVPEGKYQPAGGVLYRIAAFFSSARPMIALPMALFIMGVFIEQAIAQTPGAPSSSQQLRETAASFMTQALQIAGPVVLAWFSWKLNVWFGLKQEAQRRDALQTALTNAAGKMIQAASSAGSIAILGAAQRNKALAEGLAYIQQAAPDAIAYFKLSNGSLIEKLEAKVGLLIADTMGSTRK